MSRIARIVGAVLIAVIAAVAVDRFCIDRYRCNIESARAERQIVSMFSQNDAPSARVTARDVVETMDRCIVCSPTDVSNRMARAAALRMLGRPAEAAKEYRRALQVDRRAELFLNAGLAEVEAGRETQAEDALTTAMLVYYSNYDLMPVPAKFNVSLVVNPIYLQIQQHKASPALLQNLFDRVARVPME